MDGLDRYARMAERTRQRGLGRTAAKESAAVQWAREHGAGAAPEQLPGESGLNLDDPHRGHRTHANLLHHGSGVICSCGQLIGCFSLSYPDDEWWAQARAADPGYCTVCRARGIEQARQED